MMNKRGIGRWLAILCAAALVAFFLLRGRQTPENPPQEAELCTISVSCTALLGNLDRLDAGTRELIPADGWMLKETQTALEAGESAFDVLLRTLKQAGVHLEYVSTPPLGGAYIEGIGNLYGLSAGEQSGWLYRVNGQLPAVGSSDYLVAPGDQIEFFYALEMASEFEVG